MEQISVETEEERLRGGSSGDGRQGMGKEVMRDDIDSMWF